MLDYGIVSRECTVPKEESNFQEMNEKFDCQNHWLENVSLLLFPSSFENFLPLDIQVAKYFVTKHTSLGALNVANA